jgi:hypothetical protein
MVKDIAQIRDSLPADQRARAGITGNYGEAGAIDLYGAQYGLPKALSRVNSYWLRGYSDPPPRTLVVVGLSPEFVKDNFTSCESRGTITNRFGVPNEETEMHKYLWVCQGPREPWPDFWMHGPGVGPSDRAYSADSNSAAANASPRATEVNSLPERSFSAPKRVSKIARTAGT